VPLDNEETETSVFVNDSLLFENKSIQLLEKTSERTPCCLEIKYELTSYKIETLTLPPLEIKTKSNSFSTEAKNLVIEGKRPLDDNEIRESFSDLTPPLPLTRWAKKCLALLGLSLLFYLAFKKIKSLKPRRSRNQKPLPVQPKEHPNDWLKNQLNLLKKKLTQDPSNPLLVDEWSRIIREYVERSVCVPAMCWTTREIKKSLETQTPVLKLIPCLEDSDHFKFQPYFKGERAVFSLVTHFIKETEAHLIICGN